ncbi:putative oxidoreductase [Synechococcus sp. BIOS-U3-1]|uniref:aldo/keto reductase n=1 Tax=Synechococcus sp. BIOS-U3-1 TaxID=1400865 RepID=UPI0018616A45|nr:aldo/keto reductase [Synechococcus sp. BIOS-U3-1]QNI57177.1 putative oxidoreductase [Synechococcus sp. BIOS-U3-1]
MSKVPAICLGTAQFGSNYGVTNNLGQVAFENVKEILTHAHDMGIDIIDSAQSYGCAEEILGKSGLINDKFKIISKLSPQNEMVFNENHTKDWDTSLNNSLNKLCVASLDSLLLHSVNDLRKEGNEYLLNWLNKIKSEGLTKRIGISIYTSDDLKDINLKYIDIVQLPLSVLDQRLIRDGTIKKLTDNGIAVHARSIFLQGLLLTPSSNWPLETPREVIKHFRALEIYSASIGKTMLDTCLGFARSLQMIEAVVIGICSKKQLDGIYRSWNTNNDWDQSAEIRKINIESDFLDPRTWKPKTK